MLFLRKQNSLQEIEQTYSTKFNTQSHVNAVRSHHDVLLFLFPPSLSFYLLALLMPT